MTNKYWGAPVSFVKRKQAMLRAARSRAKRRDLPFNITIDDFEIPARCPALGIELVFNGPPDNAPSLDRVVPTMGYVKGNVAVISSRANRLKNNAEAHELRSIADFLDQHIKTDWMTT